MSKTMTDKINYIIMLINKFAVAHGLGFQQAYIYLQDYKGMDFVDEFYDVEHTLPFDEVVEDLKIYCRRMGGNIA